MDIFISGVVGIGIFLGILYIILGLPPLIKENEITVRVYHRDITFINGNKSILLYNKYGTSIITYGDGCDGKSNDPNVMLVDYRDIGDVYYIPRTVDILIIVDLHSRVRCFPKRK